MSIEIFDDDIEQLRDDLSVEPWNVISNDDVRNSCLLPIRIRSKWLQEKVVFVRLEYTLCKGCMVLFILSSSTLIMKLQNRLKSYTVVLLLSPLLFLGSLNGETGRRGARGQYLNHLLIGLMSASGRWKGM